MNPTPRRRTVLGALGGSFLAALGGCSMMTGSDGGPNTPIPEDTVLMISDGGRYYFDPIGLFVEPDTTVTFVNETPPHSATAYHKSNPQCSVNRIPPEAEPWNSETLRSQGATWEHTFTVPGTYDYYCIPHKNLGMVGRIVVGEPGGPGEQGQPPDGKVPSSDRIRTNERVTYEEFTT